MLRKRLINAKNTNCGAGAWASMVGCGATEPLAFFDPFVGDLDLSTAAFFPFLASSDALVETGFEGATKSPLAMRFTIRSSPT